MSTPKRPTLPKTGDVFDQMRALLISDFGCSPDAVAKIEPAFRNLELLRRTSIREDSAGLRSRLPAWIRAGYVSAERAATMTGEELYSLGVNVTSLEMAHARGAPAIRSLDAGPSERWAPWSGADTASTTVPPRRVPPPTRAQW
jgi:hypothetical protein